MRSIAGFFFMASVLVAGCGSSGGGLASDRASAAATLGAASAAVAAVDARSVAATEAAAAELARGQATAIAVGQAATATAVERAARLEAVEASATVGALAGQATAAADSLQATRAAWAVAATQSAAAAVRADRMANARALFGLALLVVGSLAGVLLAARAASAWLAVVDRRGSLVETRSGTVLLIAGDGGPVAQLLARPMLPAPADPDEFGSEVASARSVPIKRDGRVVGSFTLGESPSQEAARRLCLRLLRAAMLQAGPGARRIPGHRDLGWQSGTQARAVRLLGSYLRTQSGPGGGTFITSLEWPTLLDLYVAVGERRARLQGPSPADVGAARVVEQRGCSHA